MSELEDQKEAPSVENTTVLDDETKVKIEKAISKLIAGTVKDLDLRFLLDNMVKIFDDINNKFFMRLRDMDWGRMTDMDSNQISNIYWKQNNSEDNITTAFHAMGLQPADGPLSPLTGNIDNYRNGNPQASGPPSTDMPAVIEQPGGSEAGAAGTGDEHPRTNKPLHQNEALPEPEEIAAGPSTTHDEATQPNPKDVRMLAEETMANYTDLFFPKEYNTVIYNRMHQKFYVRLVDMGLGRLREMDTTQIVHFYWSKYNKADDLQFLINEMKDMKLKLAANVYSDGRVCISILHAPGDDPMGYESSAERWSPVQSVEKILLSVVSMLAEPNDESGANVDAAKMWREDRAQFNQIAERLVRQTLDL